MRRATPRSAESARPDDPPPVPIQSAGGVTASWGATGLTIRDERPRPLWAKITGQAAGTSRYAWTQLDDGDTDGTFGLNLSSGFAAAGTSAADGSPAYEISGSKLVPTGAKVLLWPAGDGSFWLFDYLGTAALPKAVSASDTPVHGTAEATTLSQYAVDNPTTSSPVFQSVVDNNGGNTSPPTPTVALKLLTDGTAGASGYTATVLGSAAGVAQTVAESYYLGGIAAAGITWSIVAGVLTATYGAVAVNLSAATVTGYTPTPATTYPKWTPVTKTYTQFTAAGTTATLTLGTLAANEVVIEVIAKHSIAFTASPGPLTNCTATFGVTGTTNFFAGSLDVKAAVSDSADYRSTTEKRAWTSTSITVTLTANVALNTLTAGSLTVWYLSAVLP